LADMKGEKIYEYDLDITGMTDYGMTRDWSSSGTVDFAPATLCRLSDRQDFPLLVTDVAPADFSSVQPNLSPAVPGHP